MTRAAPGSLRWLLLLQLRWQWQALSGRQRGGLGLLLGLVALLTAGAYLVLRGVDLSGPLPDSALLPLGGTLLLLFTLMLSSAISSSVEMLFTRGDLDLLLHSPLSPRVVLASRALGVALTAMLGVALLGVPLLLVALALGAWRALGLALWVAAAGLLSASAGLWLTLGLVRLIGVRRTRTVASVIGALTGAAFFLVSQWGNLGPRGNTAELAGALDWLRAGVGPWPAPDHPVWYPARTVWFEAGPAAAFVGLSVLVFALTVPALARQFASGVQEVAAGEGSAGPARARRRAAESGRPLRFVSGRRATLLKEWRLIRRDPELLSRTLLQLVYLIPLLLPVARGGGVRGAAGAGVVLLSANLASALANITLNAEEAPDLLRAAPRGMSRLRGEKWLAAVWPTAALGGVGLLVLALRGTLGGPGGPLLLPLLLLGTGGAALMVLWRPLPVRRADLFRKPPKLGLGHTLLQIAFQLSLAATAYAASAAQTWGVFPLVAALGSLALAHGLRRPEDG